MPVARLRPQGVVFFCILVLAWHRPTAGQVNVLTYHNDVARTGQNTQEALLTPKSVNSGQFGKLWCKPNNHLDGAVYGQPLVLSNVSIAGGTHNVVFVGTSNDSVYALDAAAGATYWQRSLLGTGERAVNGGDFKYGGNMPQTGVLATPVIDPVSQTIYVTAHIVTSNAFVLRLYALDVRTGANKTAPVVIMAKTAGTGNGAQNGQICLNTLDTPACVNLRYLYQRTGLLLSGNHIVFGLGAAGNDGTPTEPWFGWLLSYNASTLSLEAAFAPDATSYAGGIWMSGAAPAADASGYIYLATGNGQYGLDNNGHMSFGDSILKMPPPQSGSSWMPTAWYSPSDQAGLNTYDGDLGSGGVVLLSNGGQQLLVMAGKEGTIYLLNTQQSGQSLPSVQSIPGANTSIGTGLCSSAEIDNSGQNNLVGVWGLPAYWNGNLYFGSSQPDCPTWVNRTDHMKAYSFNGTGSPSMSSAPTSFTPNVFGPALYPWSTTIPSVSSNGRSNGIVWAVDQGDTKTQVSTLHAYDATNLGIELYNSNMSSTRDRLDATPSHVVPTVANGMVYVGTSDCVTAYGPSAYNLPLTSLPSVLKAILNKGKKN
jgi:hypothetical protein